MFFLKILKKIKKFLKNVLTMDKCRVIMNLSTEGGHNERGQENERN